MQGKDKNVSEPLDFSRPQIIILTHPCRTRTRSSSFRTAPLTRKPVWPAKSFRSIPLPWLLSKHLY